MSRLPSSASATLTSTITSQFLEVNDITEYNHWPHKSNQKNAHDLGFLHAPMDIGPAIDLTLNYRSPMY